MKHLFTLGLVSLFSLSVANTMAYSIHGDSNSGFILMCEDGTSNTSGAPPNHNTAVAFCEGHGGIAQGYPKAIDGVAKQRTLNSTATNSTATNLNSRHYNSSRSNKNSQ